MADWEKNKQAIKQKYEEGKIIGCRVRDAFLSRMKLPTWCQNGLHYAYRSWQTVILCLLTFLFFYYFLGSQLAENIDVKTEYALPKEKSVKMETAHAMAFLLRREVDEKMWTPNLPPLFPVYILDNMPNFQKGIIAGVHDMNNVLRRLKGLSEVQHEDLSKAGKMLNYAPDVWLLSKQGSFGIAPSSNAQYRKAAKYLQKFNMRADFVPQSQNLALVLAQMSKKISDMAQKSETHVREYSSDFIDTKADDIFYYNCGYALAWWQISKALGYDFKDIIVGFGAYADWTYLVSSLHHAATLNPLVVRNGQPNGLWAPNHLMGQNFYLMRALAAIERIRTTLARGAYAE